MVLCQKEPSQRLWSVLCYFQLEISQDVPQNNDYDYDDKLYPRIIFPDF